MQEIATALTATEEEVMKKLKTIRTQYTREKQKVKKRKTGQGADEVHKCKWSFFEKLQFLDDFATPRKYQTWR
ncbi:hypothetical protein EMCRGX_G005952 [Ephydatia muelleri]